ncbi:uncharacterized protein LOC110457408 [Mizuhopecten yessoensis]|uniref:Apple domain-containing protein n=1 Tax=Mizuhopecten yessoensis TaxID=6573 RepID=A0A210Q8R5_MIZYE|nr:uncharacterized protein LOC110457408 [Mizuhopecten yessoensis]OWF45142.1 hypothetical protein KP79_PYT13252 [Mizuhopecten yessoensis]
MVKVYRPTIDLTVISIVIFGVLCVGTYGQSYVARRVPTLDDVLFAQTNAFTVPCTSLEDCVMLCGELKSGCLSVVFHRYTNFCRGYPVVFDTISGTVSSLGAEFYVIKYAPCPYDAGYAMYGGFCLRTVTVSDPITWFGVAGLCGVAGGSLFNSSTIEGEASIQALMSGSSNNIYYLGNGDLASDQCVALDTNTDTHITMSCSTYLQAGVCVV